MLAHIWEGNEFTLALLTLSFVVSQVFGQLCHPYQHIQVFQQMPFPPLLDLYRMCVQER